MAYVSTVTWKKQNSSLPPHAERMCALARAHQDLSRKTKKDLAEIIVNTEAEIGRRYMACKKFGMTLRSAAWRVDRLVYAQFILGDHVIELGEKPG